MDVYNSVHRNGGSFVTPVSRPSGHTIIKRLCKGLLMLAFYCRLPLPILVPKGKGIESLRRLNKLDLLPLYWGNSSRFENDTRLPMLDSHYEFLSVSQLPA